MIIKLQAELGHAIELELAVLLLLRR